MTALDLAAASLDLAADREAILRGDRATAIGDAADLYTAEHLVEMARWKVGQ